MRYHIGVDWGDQEHAVWVEDEQGQRVSAGNKVPHSAAGFSDWGQELNAWRAQGITLWAAIERPEGRVVDFLLDHGVRVYPVNPKALDRAWDRFRQSGAKDDLFDARVLAGFLRTDHGHVTALEPSTEAAQELKLLTEDCHRQLREQTRLLNQLTATLKEYYPRALEVAELTTALLREFLQAYPTPESCGVGSWGGQRPSLGVMSRCAPPDGATPGAPDSPLCWLRSLLSAVANPGRVGR